MKTPSSTAASWHMKPALQQPEERHEVLAACKGVNAFMMSDRHMTERLKIALPDIEQSFSEGPSVLTEAELQDIVRKNRRFWRLSKRETQEVFVDFLCEHSDLHQISIDLKHRPVRGYTWGRVPLMETLLQLVSGSYYSHYTAVRLHGLTEQVPKTLYLSREKKRGAPKTLPHLSQADIDTSFSRPMRESTNQADVPEEGVRVVLLDAMAHGGAGIISDQVNKKLRPCYPYHQAIGYYLERAGYKASAIELFRNHPREQDFYLTHAMGKTRYDERWRLYVPEGF